MRLAEILRGQREIELFSNAHSLVANHVGRMTLVDYCRDKIKRKSTLDHMERFFKALEIRALDERSLSDFQAHLLTKLKPATVRVTMTHLNTALNQAVREKVLVRNPANLIKKIQVKEPLTVFLSREEIQTLSRTRIRGEDGVGGRIKRAFLFSCFTGLRFSDLQRLTWAEIKGREIALVQKKTGTVVRIPINETAWSQINPGDRIPPLDEPVFGLVNKNTTHGYIPAWGKAAGLSKHLHFHIARHTFATLALESGADPMTLKNLLGHSKIEQSLHYAKVTNPLRRKAVEGMELDLPRSVKSHE